MDPLRDHPFFRQILLASAHQPFLVFLVALLFTGLIQSSAATIGIALTFAFQGMIELSAAIPVIFGANIGTCVTAFLAAIGTRREAQRVAYAHILFKILTVLICWPFIGPFTELVRLTSRELPRQIANAHTIFNLAAALLFLPALSGAERFLRRLLPHRSEKDGARWSPKYLDERILETPTLALAQVTREISRMGDTVLLMLREGVTAISQRDEAKIHKVIALDDKVDTLETTEMQAAKVASLLYLVHHLETIGDLISKNLMDVAKKVVQQQLRFSDAGSQQWQEFYNLNIKLLEKALAAFATNDKAMAQDVFKAKEEMSRMARNLHFLHLERLGRGIPETERTSDLHIHLISDLRRILSNTVSIAAAVVHEYRIPDLETDFILHQRGQ
jgi:phosphate:Na+ symporter